MRGYGGGGGDTGGAYGGVGVSEAADNGGEDFGEVRGEVIAVSLREEGDEADALLSDRRLVRGVGG